MHTYHSTDTNINETIRIWQVLNHYSIQHRKQIYYFVGNITPLLERRNFDYQHMIFPRISNLFYVSYFREKSLIYDLRVSENSTYVTRSIKPRMYVHGILTPPDNLQMQLHVGSPKNWQVLDLIILYKHVHINIYICTINNISTSHTNRGMISSFIVIAQA